MAKSILMPQVGQDLTEGTVVELHVGLGDAVAKGDVVAVVESEKASFEVEAFEAGTVIGLPYSVGDTATVLEPLVWLGDPGESPPAGNGAAAPESGPGPSASVPVADTPRAETVAAAPAPAFAPAPAPASAPAPNGGRASPLARRLARRHGLDLASLSGTGPGGSVVKRDIEAALAEGGAPAARAPLSEEPAPIGAPPVAAAAAAGSPALRGLREGTGDPVVFLHGFGSDLSSWRGFVGGVAAPNPLTALDLPGHGASAGVAAAGFDALVDAVAAGLEAAGQTRVHLVGHSLGAAVAVALAGGGTLDVRSLTLLAPAGLGPAIDGAFVQGFCAADGEPALAAWMARLVHDPSALSPTLVRATARARQAGGVAAAQARLAAALFPSGTQVFGVRPALARYAGPARIVVGLNDAIIPPGQTDGLPGHVAVHRLAGVGHLPQLEAGPLVGRLVDETVRSAG